MRLSTLLLALVGIGCVDAALGVWQKRGWRFRWKAALALALLAFLVAASEWPGDAANAVRSATMDRSAAARYIGVYAPPLLRLAVGALFFFLARRNRPAGAVLLAVGGFCLAVDLAAVVLNRLSIDFWNAPSPFSWILFDENTLSLFSACSSWAWARCAQSGRERGKKRGFLQRLEEPSRFSMDHLVVTKRSWPS